MHKSLDKNQRCLFEIVVLLEKKSSDHVWNFVSKIQTKPGILNHTRKTTTEPQISNKIAQNLWNLSQRALLHFNVFTYRCPSNMAENPKIAGQDTKDTFLCSQWKRLEVSFSRICLRVFKTKNKKKPLQICAANARRGSRIQVKGSKTLFWDNPGKKLCCHFMRAMPLLQCLPVCCRNVHMGGGVLWDSNSGWVTLNPNQQIRAKKFGSTSISICACWDKAWPTCAEHRPWLGGWCSQKHPLSRRFPAISKQRGARRTPGCPMPYLLPSLIAKSKIDSEGSAFCMPHPNHTHQETARCYVQSISRAEIFWRKLMWFLVVLYKWLGEDTWIEARFNLLTLPWSRTFLGLRRQQFRSRIRPISGLSCISTSALRKLEKTISSMQKNIKNK